MLLISAALKQRLRPFLWVEPKWLMCSVWIWQTKLCCADGGGVDVSHLSGQVHKVSFWDGNDHYLNLNLAFLPPCTFHPSSLRSLRNVIGKRSVIGKKWKHAMFIILTEVADNSKSKKPFYRHSENIDRYLAESLQGWNNVLDKVCFELALISFLDVLMWQQNHGNQHLDGAPQEYERHRVNVDLRLRK